MEENLAYEKNLEQQSQLLKECQAKHNLQSCLKCDKVIDCDIRNAYVDSVYKSMNLGQEAHFEFENAE